MVAKHSRHTALAEPLIAAIGGRVAKGAYTSASEVVRTALRLPIERDHATGSRVPAKPEAVLDRA